MKKIGLLAFLLSTALFAQENQVKLNESVITSQNFATTVRNTAANVSIVTAKDIEEKGCTNLIEALRMVPGILVKNYYGKIAFDLGGYSSVHAERNNIITLDGVKISKLDATLIPVESIERIEVIPNDGGVLHGDGAAGGTINILSKNIYGKNSNKKISGKISVGTASEHSYNYGLSTTVNATDKLALRVDYSNKKVKSWRRPNDGKKLKSKYETVSLAGDYKFDNSVLTLKYTRNNSDIAVGGDLPEKLYKEDRKQATWPWIDSYKSDDFYLTYKGKVGENTEFLTYGNFYKLTSLDEDKVKTSLFEKKFAKAQVKHAYMDKNYFIVGGDYQKAVTKPYSDGAKTGRNVTKTETGIFAMNEFKYGDFTFGQGLRYGKTAYDYYWRDKFPIPEDLRGEKGNQNFKNWAGDLSVKYNYSDTGMVYGKVSRSFRTPINREIYYTVDAQKLKSQIQKNFEIGVKDYIGENIFVSASTFYKLTDGEIYYQGTRMVENGKVNNYFPYYNMGDTRRIGVELLSEQYLGKFTLTESISYLNHKIVKSDFKSREGKEIPMVPNWKAGFGVSYKYNDKLNLDANIVYVGKCFDSDDPENVREKDICNYATVDVSANYRFDNGIGVVARVNNLFNKEYTDYVGYWDDSRQLSPAVGRNFSLGIDYKF